MKENNSSFNEHRVLHELAHYLPSQAPLKDFIHHNTLHAFQNMKFHEGLHKASRMFGFKVYLSISEYRELFNDKKINDDLLNIILINKYGEENLLQWRKRLFEDEIDETLHQRIGYLYQKWKDKYYVFFNKEVHPVLFRLISNYVDQGVSFWKLPTTRKSFLNSIRELENRSIKSIFRSKRARNLLFQPNCKIKDLLNVLIGDETLFENYLFDQQFSHPGWSGMVSVLERQPESLLDKRGITLSDFIFIELLLEIDVLDAKYGENWLPLSKKIHYPTTNLFKQPEKENLFEILAIWQEAFEWTYYDEVLMGLQITSRNLDTNKNISFQSVFCIDDRECSFRRYLETKDENCETFSTAGFFNIEFYYQPEQGKFLTKVCPAPIQPNHIIKEYDAKKSHKKDINFSKKNNAFFGGFIGSQTIGFWSALKLSVNIFKPIETSIMVSPFKHMDKNGKLHIENMEIKIQNQKQYGFTVDEMADRIEGLLKSIGLTNNFAPLIYFVGHGASSVNNTYYAGYDCGACSGRSGSVNARVAAYMANHRGVRRILTSRGINIPDKTWFVGGVHDTTRDIIEFYDEEQITITNILLHNKNVKVFLNALDQNAKERSRRFLMTDSKNDSKKVHENVKKRAMSLFEPRPEWNHASNALCLVGRRETNKNLFLDRRAFLNSYDYRLDSNGEYLLGILKAVIPVCGGINLEYYFSKVDNYRLGAGSKLPHNVIALIGVANGMDGDLRTGLPKQMINIHDSIRLLVIVEHFPTITLKVIQQHQPTYEWIKNEWIHFVVMHPETKEMYRFNNEKFEKYKCITKDIPVASSIEKIFENDSENLPVYLLNKNNS